MSAYLPGEEAKMLRIEIDRLCAIVKTYEDGARSRAMSEEEMLVTLKAIDDSGRRIADERDRLRAVNAALVAALEWATKQIGILSQYIETPEALAKFDECRAALALAKGEKT